MPDLKWFVFVFTLVAFGLVLNFDLQFGIAVGVILAVIGAIWLYLTLRLAPERGAPKSERGAMVERFSRLDRNRREAREKELGAERGPDPS
jgi:MFS superfamily sulfate permease-like transporter